MCVTRRVCFTPSDSKELLPTPANDADESARNEPEPEERHARLGSVHRQIGERLLHRLQGRPGLHCAAGADDVHDRLAEPRPDVQLLRQASDKALNQSGQSNTVTVTTPRDTTPPTVPELSGTVRGRRRSR